MGVARAGEGDAGQPGVVLGTVDPGGSAVEAQLRRHRTRGSGGQRPDDRDDLCRAVQHREQQLRVAGNGRDGEPAAVDAEGRARQQLCLLYTSRCV